MTFVGSVVLTIHLVMMPVFHGGNFLCSVEDLRKITEGGESQQLCDLGHGQVSFCQQVFAFLQAPGDHIVDRGDAILPFEGMGEVEFVHVRLFCQLIQSQRFFKMLVDVPADGGALVVANIILWGCRDGKAGAAHEADN